MSSMSMPAPEAEQVQPYKENEGENVKPILRQEIHSPFLPGRRMLFRRTILRWRACPPGSPCGMHPVCHFKRLAIPGS
jgi:hypothetical protein